MDSTFPSGRLQLACYLRSPATLGGRNDSPADAAGVRSDSDSDGQADLASAVASAAERHPARLLTSSEPAATGVILCHGFPTGPLDARKSAGTYPELVDRIVHEVGVSAMAFNFRGCGTSPGDFSLQGWVDDLRAAVEHITSTAGVTRVILVGTNTGGSIAICAGVDDRRIAAAALLGSRAGFDDWADHPRRFLEHARQIGAVRSQNFPPAMDEWTRELRRFRPLSAMQRFAPRPVLIMHGDNDEMVPATDSRQLAQAHGSAEFSVLEGAGHRLRHDPRAIAILLGWVDRMR